MFWNLYGPGAPHAQSSRGSFWWRDVFSLVTDYRSITRSVVGNGELTLFWKDFWMGQELLCDKYSRLYSFVTNEDSSVANMSRMEDWALSLPCLYQLRHSV